MQNEVKKCSFSERVQFPNRIEENHERIVSVKNDVVVFRFFFIQHANVATGVISLFDIVLNGRSTLTYRSYLSYYYLKY
jgi:hypothetical protein